MRSMVIIIYTSYYIELMFCNLPSVSHTKENKISKATFYSYNLQSLKLNVLYSTLSFYNI